MFTVSSIDSFGESVRKFTESFPEDNPIRLKLQALLPAIETPLSRNSPLARAVVQLSYDDLTLQQRIIYEDFIAQFPEISALHKLIKKLDKSRIERTSRIKEIERRIELLVPIYFFGKPHIDRLLSILEDLENVQGAAEIDLSPVLEWILRGSFPLLDPVQTRLFALYSEKKQTRKLEFTNALPATESTIRAKALACHHPNSSLTREIFSYARSLSEEEMLEMLKNEWAQQPHFYAPLCEILTRNFSTSAREDLMELVHVSLPGTPRFSVFDPLLTVTGIGIDERMAFRTSGLQKQIPLIGGLDERGSNKNDVVLPESVKESSADSHLERLAVTLSDEAQCEQFALFIKRACCKKLCVVVTALLDLTPLLLALHDHLTIDELEIQSSYEVLHIEEGLIGLWLANPKIRTKTSISGFYPFDELLKRKDPQLIRRFLSQIAEIPLCPTEAALFEQEVETSEELDSEAMSLLANLFPQLVRESKPGSLGRLYELTPFKDSEPCELIHSALFELQTISDALHLNCRDFSSLFSYVLTGEVPPLPLPNDVKLFRAFWERRTTIPILFVQFLPVTLLFLNEKAAAAVALRDSDLHRQVLTLLQKLSCHQLKRCFNHPWAHDSWFYFPLIKLLAKENRRLGDFLSFEKMDKLDFSKPGFLFADSEQRLLYGGPFGILFPEIRLSNESDYPLVSSVSLSNADEEALSFLSNCQNLVHLSVTGLSGNDYLPLISSLKSKRVRRLHLFFNDTTPPVTLAEKGTPYLTHLKIGCASIGEAMIQLITDSKHLETLVFSNCTFNMPAALSLAIQTHPSLKEVKMEASMVDDWSMVTTLLADTNLESLILGDIDLPPEFAHSVKNTRIPFLELNALPLEQLSPSLESLSVLEIRSQEILESILVAAEASSNLTQLELHIRFQVDPSLLLAFMERNRQIEVKTNCEGKLIAAIAQSKREDLLPLVLNPLLK